MLSITSSEAGGLNLGIYSIAKEAHAIMGYSMLAVTNFFNLDIPVPPAEEQKRLADVLML